MDRFIKSLKSFAKEDFPIKKVSDFILSYDFSKKTLDKYSHFNEKTFARNMIYKDQDFQILLICWSPGQLAPIHGHEGEKCWFKIISGTLEICNYKLESRSPLKLKKIEKIHAHKGYLDGPADIHSVNNFSKEPVVTLHIYAKPYDSCETYDIETKQIKRMEMKYHSIDGKLC